MIKILTVGLATYDIYVQVDEYPKENQKMRFINKVGCGGGCGANIAYLLAKWGTSSIFAGVTGNDVYGTRARKELQEVGVDLRFLETSYEKDTVLSFNIVNPKNQSRTVYQVADEFVKLKKMDYDFSPELIVTDGNDTYAAKKTIEGFPKAISIIDADRFTPEISSLVQRCNYAVCSLSFACAATNMRVDFTNNQTLVNLYDELRRKYDHQTIVITLGSHGAMYMVNNEIKISPAFKVNVIDKTGAGDIFTGAFSYGIANNYGLEKSIKFGNIAAGLSLQKLGARLSIPKLDEVIKVYEKNS